MSFVVGDSQISLKQCRRHLLAAIQLAVSCNELYLLATVSRNGPEHSRRQARLCVYLN